MYSLITFLFADTPVDFTSLPNHSGGSGSGDIKFILGIVYGIVGALALLFIIISGFRYIISDGDPQKTAQAKQGIIYAVVGIVVAIMAQAITVFIVSRIS